VACGFVRPGRGHGLCNRRRLTPAVSTYLTLEPIGLDEHGTSAWLDARGEAGRARARGFAAAAAAEVGPCARASTRPGNRLACGRCGRARAPRWGGAGLNRHLDTIVPPPAGAIDGALRRVCAALLAVAKEHGSFFRSRLQADEEGALRLNNTADLRRAARWAGILDPAVFERPRRRRRSPGRRDGGRLCLIPRPPASSRRPIGSWCRLRGFWSLPRPDPRPSSTSAVCGRSRR